VHPDLTLEPEGVRLLEPRAAHILGVTKTTTLPGAPDGEYGVLTYSAAFTNKASAVETVILARDGEQWKIVGYFIR
jgi:hypothetical protein